jgi:hypothetical protein
MSTGDLALAGSRALAPRAAEREVRAEAPAMAGEATLAWDGVAGTGPTTLTTV